MPSSLCIQTLQLNTKLNKLKNLILALRDAEPILGDCNVAVTVPAGEVKIPLCSAPDPPEYHDHLEHRR